MRRVHSALEVLALRPLVAVLKRKRLRPTVNSRDRRFRSRWSDVRVTETARSIGTTRYVSFLFRVDKRLSAGLTVLFTGALTDSTQRVSYQNNGMDPIGHFILRDGGTPPWQYTLSSTYNLPFFRNSKGVTRAMLGGWQTSGIVSWFPGGIITVSGANSMGVDPALPHPSYNRWFNTCTINNNTGARQNCASTPLVIYGS